MSKEDSRGVGQLSERHWQPSEGIGQLSEGLVQLSAQSGQLSEGVGELSPTVAQLVEQGEVLQGEKRELHAGAESMGEEPEDKEGQIEGTGLERNEGAVAGAGVLTNEDGGKVAAAGWWRGFSRVDDVRAELSVRSVGKEDAERGTGMRTERVEGEGNLEAQSELSRRGVERIREREEVQTADEAGREGGENSDERAGDRVRTSRESEEPTGDEVTERRTKTQTETETETETEGWPKATAPKRGMDGSEEEIGTETVTETETKTEAEKGVVSVKEGTGQPNGGSRQLDLWKAPDRKGFRPCLEKMAAEQRELEILICPAEC